MTNEELWQTVLAQIQLNISQANFATWFKETEIISQKGPKVTVSVPNSFVKEWLENKYNKHIFKIIYNVDKNIKEITYIINKKSLKSFKKEPISRIIPEEIDQLKFKEFKVNKDTNLNPRYIFDSFIVGSFNELPYAAAYATAKDPGIVYNPLFIYGGVGLGKTHLLQAIGNEIVKKFQNKKVKYIPSEKFTSEVVSGIQNHNIELFKKKYKDIDVLIIDDIQFLAGKEKTQEEFFNLFNVLYEKDKQIILSSDRPPKSIMSLAERLRSRFEGGMIADISMPDIETRIAILKTKAQEKKSDFSDDIYEYIASVVQKNIRELEGALNRLIFYKKVNKKELDINIAKTVLKNLFSAPTIIITPKKIIQTVAMFYDLKEKDLITTSRKKEIVKPRQIAMYLLREELKNSFPFIGKKLGGKDHTTAIHSYKKILNNIEKDKKLEEEIYLIKEQLINQC
ncbi:MAG: chromosomal replication initiator protein DnaA [Patescibacteria group bacterium]|nr:chromosomal replication initiator protein DnaA [Patescibacteria group bacterium]